MRYVQPAVLLLGAAIYAMISAALVDLINARIPVVILAVLSAWYLLLFLSTVVAIINCVLRIRAEKTRRLATDAVLVKLTSIPFFVLNFAAVICFLLVGAVMAVFADPTIGFTGTIGLGMTYVTLLCTSIPVWAAIAQLRRERIIGTGRTVLYSILCCLFVTDIAAGVLVFGHSRRRPRLAMVWVMLGAGAAVSGVGLLFLVASQVPIRSLTLFGGFGSIVAPILRDIVGVAEWLPTALILAGIGVIVATLLVSFVRRSTLRREAQLAAVPNAGT